jgi:hypothetical protein
MANARLFKSNDTVETTIQELLAAIRKPAWTGTYTALRKYQQEGKMDKGEWILQQINTFSVSCGLTLFEIGNISAGQLQNLKQVLSGTEYTYACFLNMAASGLIVIANLGEDSAKETQEQLVAHYERLTGLTIDRTLVGGKCYMTWDPDLYINEDCKAFNVCNTANEVNPMLDLITDLVPMKIHEEPDVIEPEPIEPGSVEKDSEVTQVGAVPGLPPGLTSLFDTPTIPDEIFVSLPTLLMSSCAIFKDKRERDVYLTGSIVVIGASMEDVWGLYDNKKSFPNLYSFIIAPAANSKGVMEYSQKLGQGLDRKYQLQGQGTMKTLFIPGNISASMVIQMLNASKGKGVFYETEADTLVNALAKEWGNFSDVLRKAFHSERISQARIGNLQFDVIEEPRLSILLSGTPEQVKGLIPSTENGLFSRMTFYAYQKALRFKDVRPNREVNYIELFEGLSEKIVAMEEFLAAHPTRFEFTDGQWDRFQQMYNKTLVELTDFVSSDLEGTVLRIGSIHFRISMILSALRKAEIQSTEKIIVCSDNDFEIGAKLAATYLEHAKIVYGLLPKARKAAPISSKQKFLDALPTGEFSRQKAVEVAIALKIGERSVGDYLKELAEQGLLEKPSHGLYKRA